MDHSKTVKRSILLCAAVLASCNWYDKTTVQNIAGPVPAGARVLFFNFGVNAPGVNFYANATKITATSSTKPDTESTIGVPYGGVAAGGFYSAIAAGQYSLTGRIADTTGGFKGRPVDTLSAAIADGKAYSFYMSGIYNAVTKIVDAFVVEDPFGTQIDYSLAYVRFVHAISNANPMTLYATIPNANDATKVDTVAVGAQVAYKSAGAFTPLAQGVYNLATRYVGDTTSAIRRTGVSFLAGRVYTVTARGDITVTTGAAAPTLDNTANR